MNSRLILALVLVLLVAAGTAVWLLAPGPDTAAGTRASPGAINPIDPSLAPTIDAATAASTQALADTSAADATASATDAVAIRAAEEAASGKTAAARARDAATKACRAPSQTQGCATAPDGSRYEGAQACNAQGCAPDGFGVFTDKKRGWESQGQWENGALVLGCDLMKGVITYCGRQVASAWSGFGISYNEKAAAISAEWKNGKGQNPIQLDYPTGSRMRGAMVNYELDGPGVYERADKRVLKGRWQAGQLASGTVTYPETGDRVSGVFSAGIATSGVIEYRDGRRFVGTLEDTPTLPQPLPRSGVLYAPNGQIEHQGAWQAGFPVTPRP